MPIWFVLNAGKFLKKHWKPLVVIVAFVGLYVTYRWREDAWTDRYVELQKNHEDVIKKIDVARQEERRLNEANLKELQAKLDEVKVVYESQIADLKAKRARVVKDIVVQHGDDPVALAEELAKVTGFKVAP